MCFTPSAPGGRCVHGSFRSSVAPLAGLRVPARRAARVPADQRRRRNRRRPGGPSGRHDALSGGRIWTLPQGSIWIRTDLAAAGAPPGSYFGITIASGTLTLDAPSVVIDNTLIALGNFTLEIAPENRVAAGPPDGPGADVRGSSFVPPASSTWRFVNGRVAEVEAGDLQVEVFGGAFSLMRTAAAPVWDPLFARVSLPFEGNPADFTPVSQSMVFSLTGAAASQRAGAWMLTARTADPGALGEAPGPGSAHLVFESGLEAAWTGLRNGTLALPETHVLAGGGELYLAALQVRPGRARHWMRLWYEEEKAPEDGAALEARFDRASRFLFASMRSGTEAFSASASIVTHTERFRTADGNAFGFEGPGEFSITADAAGLHSNVDAVLRENRGASFAVSNALLATNGPQSVSLDAILDAAGDSLSGRLRFGFSLTRVVPMLPDPYAANFDIGRPQGPAKQLTAAAAWPEPAAPEFALAIDGDPIELLPPALSDEIRFPEVPQRMRRLDVVNEIRRQAIAFWLLDTSSRADHLGVAFGRGETPARIEDLSLAVPGMGVGVFMLPAVQWEPVEVPAAGLFISADNGGPAAMSAQTVKLVPAAPVPAVLELVSEIADAKVDGTVSFSLPFGIRARVDLKHFSDLAHAPIPVPEVGFNMPVFESHAGAWQLKFRGVEPSMRGYVRQLDNIALPAGAKNVLDFYAGESGGGAPTVSAIFNARFAGSVPLERFDLSGYGESCFSDWRNPAVMPPDVSHVRFDVIAGRTSHEVVQVVAYLLPCDAVMVRTITLDRKGNAFVVRHDSGWLATTPGLFQVSGSTCRFHRGAVRGYYNIREVKDTDVVVNVRDGGTLQAVYFDADVSIEGAGRGSRDEVFDGVRHRVAGARRHLGYIQLLPIKAHLTPAQLADLFAKKGPIGGPLDCEVEIGAGRQKIRLAGMYAASAPRPGSSTPEFAVAVHGAPDFPKSGQWSAVRLRQTSVNPTDVIPVDGRIGVPLVRVDAAGSPYRIDDPSNLLVDSAESAYGFLFGSDSSRVLFGRPRIRPASVDTYETDPPKLADPAALAGSPGLFPKANLVAFPSAPLDLGGAGPVLPPVSTNASREFLLVDTPLFRLRSRAIGTPFDIAIGSSGWKVGSGARSSFSICWASTT